MGVWYAAIDNWRPLVVRVFSEPRRISSSAPSASILIKPTLLSPTCSTRSSSFKHSTSMCLLLRKHVELNLAPHPSRRALSFLCEIPSAALTKTTFDALLISKFHLARLCYRDAAQLLRLDILFQSSLRPLASRRQ